MACMTLSPGGSRPIRDVGQCPEKEPRWHETAAPGPSRRAGLDWGRSPAGASGPAEAGVAGEHDRLRAVLDLELGEDVRDVVAHGLLGEAERRGDLGVVAALGDQLHQLVLA